MRRTIAALIIAGLCLLSFPTTAQQSGVVSDDDFTKLDQQIRELKNPTFRAFLRTRLLSWEAPSPSQGRRQAARAVAIQGISDLCDHQDEVWTPTASWLHEGFVKQIRVLQSAEDTALAICVLKTDATSSVARDLSSGIKLLRSPDTSEAGLDLARSAILSGQVSTSAMLGQLSSSTVARSPHLPALLDAVLSLEEKQPGMLPLRLLPFFSSVFLEKSVPPEITTRFLTVAVRATRLSAQELTDPTVRGPVTALLNGIISPAQRLTPALYPEIASRLSSLNRNALNANETRLAADARIDKASDQLEQLISEATSASDEQLEKHFLFRAARLAQEQGQFSKAVDLALKVESPTWINEFLSQTGSLAIKKKSPHDASYAISKMTQALKKAEAFRLLGEYYGANQDHVRSKEAFSQSGKQLKLVDNTNEKAKTALLLGESVLKYEPADAYEAFREAVRTINNLPSPEKDQEQMYYVKLLPVAEDLIRSFRLLASRENETAMRLAAEIKLSELRVSALSGAYSGQK